MNRLRKPESLKAKEKKKPQQKQLHGSKQMELQVLVISKRDHKRNVIMLAVTSTSGLRALATAVRLMPGVYYVT
jgi:hypothetical protein